MAISGTEINFDGLVGPTHNYSGLSEGNLASVSSGGQVSSPRRAALQGLAKMRLLVSLGLTQGILPPHRRPALTLARGLGYSGLDQEIVADLAKHQPRLLASLYSASSMWVANAGVVSASADTLDGRVHLSPANLVSKLHRSIEAPFTERVLRRVFSGDHFVVHPPLPAHPTYGDEGAANHERVWGPSGQGVELFVWGRAAFGPNQQGRFVSRQTDAACEALVRRHGVKDSARVFVQQSQKAIDAGAFHNDVVAVGHGNTLLFHQDAFEDTAEVLSELRQKSLAATGSDLKAVEVSAHDLPLEKAIKSYLFNSQLLDLPGGEVMLLAPAECEEDPSVHALIQSLMGLRARPFEKVTFVNLKESMKNGGGPACLRLRVMLTTEELAAVHTGVLLDLPKIDRLETWVKKHYRDELSAQDLSDPSLPAEVDAALAELEGILDLEGLYEFENP